ncbi:MFS transporter [Akkermansiaceae bacterium]|nr:MFS transporter [Akkermansiaceae bacterium]
MSNEKPNMGLFWGCFIALITTAFAFITRAFLCNDPTYWQSDFGLDGVKAGELFGAGIWTFAISIILFSLIIDKVGYRVAMIFSFVCYLLYAVFALMAYNAINPGGEPLTGEALTTAQKTGVKYLTWGSMILGLGNGTVEAFINPVVATMFSKDKTKWLNILHAGWPGGLVIGGLLTLALGGQVADDWRVLVYLIALPAVVYLVMLIKVQFPVNERVASGTSYREMLAEFGVLGALIAFGLVFKQLGMVLGLSNGVVIALVLLSAGAYGFYCRSMGRPLLIVLCLIMIPLATTELGTDGAITGIMEEEMAKIGSSGLWVLIYTSGIMCVLRFFAGPIVGKTGPLGLLALSSTIAAVGLFWLAGATGLAMIFAAATLYGIGKTFFWPTILGVVAEQTPKGGAVTLNAIAAIGMLSVGILGNSWIGAQTEKTAQASIEGAKPGIYETVSKSDTYIFGEYSAIDASKVEALGEAEAEEVNHLATAAKQSALGKIAVLPILMLISFIGIIFYFKSRGGYKAEAISDH